MNSFFREIGEFLTPILSNSNFNETGVITPKEFVDTGDYLTFKFPTWQWMGGNLSYMPKEKQYLVTRNVPSFRRIRELEKETTEETYEDDFVQTHNNICNNNEVIPEIDNVDNNSESIPDMEEFEEEDPAVFIPSGANILKNRTYDIFITYDKLYQTPRLWLQGYNENKEILSPEEIFEDISQDHAQKTVTVERFPHLPISLVSIHPCKHANVMKVLMERMRNSNNKQCNNESVAIRVDLYLPIFLKFMSCVIPTINYDHTGSMKAS
jgi:ubiquitin-like-conjugating enzyme ATG3